ncbi:MiaB/RimO family radical SAM methylthiotransferase [Treponema phagedenis]|uniref:MiaB/RimO family radical SAM methylthiotransferase n=1 Tax=Treponema phagedenis TaxID=162 RepID=UPI0004662FCA|nr:MiaB/RimO family radical SAM methylthiotransferase [Treponema phagedenis]NVP24049.1 MiaB/RimO family radical SAM methylthiotransferase [Treponema phagedenis]QKS93689.1 MiaB/RimO family radical SAM methylthiotransferase [Treponema phagedenis]QLC60415.1 MiaB/RimO family radical SAM methylthiotransferase [Treponema phagedenis]
MLTKQFFLDQHGCAKNQVDGELLIGILQQEGWVRAKSAETADIIIVNSCGFIEAAKLESIEAVISARSRYPNAKILLAGCLAERYAEEFQQELPEADAFFGNGDLSQLPKIVHQMITNTKKDYRPALVPEQKGISCGIRPEILNFPRSVFIKITEGCNHRCSFCAIPLIRGNLRSRPIEDCVQEIQQFIKSGCYEFNLIGQDLAAFQGSKKTAYNFGTKPQGSIKSIEQTFPKKQSGLAELLQAISALEGDFRVRLLYIHPDNFPLDILPIMTQDSRFLPYFDLPFQSGSANILHLMNRRGSAEKYLELADTIRNAFRKAKSPYKTTVFRTTFLTGFPGETDFDFKQTEDFLTNLKSLWSGAFVFSKEEGTKAEHLPAQVPKKLAEKRLRILQDLQTEITQESLQFFCGYETDILIEEIIENAEIDGDSKVAIGRAWFQAPEVDGAIVVNYTDEQRDRSGNPFAPGSIIKAKIIAPRGFDLEAVAL